jgi:hypothetical protein
VRNLVLIAALATLFACSRYLGSPRADVSPVDQLSPGERLAGDGSVADRAVDGVSSDAPGLDLARDGSAPDADGAAQDLVPPSCISWTSDWSCDHTVSGYTCVASCGAKKILCDNDKYCTCNGTDDCKWHSGAGCPVCASAFQSGCCQ